MSQESREVSLDKCLKALYSAFRYTGATLVAIRFIHDGKQWEADTPEEAIRLRESLRIAALKFIGSTGELGQAFIKYLLKQPRMLIPSSEITKALKLKKEIELAGVLSGLSKQLKKLNLRPHQLYFVDVSWDGKEKERSLAIDAGFEVAATEMGWPEE